MEISVVIPTYNNAKKLKNALNSLHEAEKPKGMGYEVIVVDNHSKDDTKGTVDAAIPLFEGRLRYVLEVKQGVSYARNSGIREAKGEFVAFIDDDVIVDRQWLVELLKNIRFFNADCIAGKIIPKWEIPKPRWITGNLGMALGLLDYGKKPFLIDNLEQEIVTANFVVKRNIFNNKNYLFKTFLGDKGKKIIKGEDTELFFNLMKGGYRIWYCPSCFVHHDISKERMRVLYFLKWNYQHSQSKVYLMRMYPEAYGSKELNRRLFKKMVESLKSIDKNYIELLGGIFFCAGLLKNLIRNHFRLK